MNGFMEMSFTSFFLSRPRRGALLLLGPLFLFSCASNPRPVKKEAKEPLFFPLPPDPPRIQFLRSLSRASQVEPPPSGLDSFLFGKKARKDFPIARPFGISFYGGCFYLADSNLDLILKVDLKGKKLTKIALSGRAAGGVPKSISFGPGGNVYLAVPSRGQVVELDKDFHYLREFGPFGKKSRPVDAKVFGGRLYVVDVWTTQVHVLDLKSGKELFRFGSGGPPASWMRAPIGIAFDRKGFAYVTDAIHARVFIWDRDGNFVRSFGGWGRTPGKFSRPKGIAVFGKLVFVLDAGFENCQVFDLRGKVLLPFSGPGLAPGRLYLPACIWVGKEGLDLFKDDIAPDFAPEALIAITSQVGPNKVSFFALGRSRKFTYPPEDLPSSPREGNPSEKEGR